MSSLGLLSFSGYSLPSECEPGFGVEFRVFTHLASPPPTQGSPQTTMAVVSSPLILPEALCSHFSASTRHSLTLLRSWLCIAFVQGPPQLLESGDLSLICGPPGINTMTP